MSVSFRSLSCNRPLISLPNLLPKWIGIAALLFLALATAPSLRADLDPDWTTSLPPFRIAGNLYYVGSKDLASFLVTTPAGLILINSNLTSSPAQIETSVEKLGFHFRDIKILLISHGHYDHCAGSSEILRKTHAKYMVMDADVPLIQSGGRTDFHYANDPSMRFPSAHVDRILHDEDQVTLGGVTLVAHKTAGHTKGCTTWTMLVHQKDGQKDRTLNVVIVGSPNANSGYKLVNNPKYLAIASDFKRQFQTLNALPCDIFLGAHGGYFDLLEKSTRLNATNTDTSSNPFIDPAGYKAFVANRQQAFETELKKQQTAR